MAEEYDLNSQILPLKSKLRDGLRQIDAILREKQNSLDATERAATSKVSEMQELIKNFEKKMLRDVVEGRSRLAEKAMTARRTIESDLLKVNCIEGVMCVTPRGTPAPNQMIDICDVDSIINEFRRMTVNVDSNFTKSGYETVDTMLGRLNIINPLMTPVAAPMRAIQTPRISATPMMPLEITESPIARPSSHLAHGEYDVFTSEGDPSQVVHMSAPTQSGKLGLEQINETTVDHYICHMTSTPEGGLVTANYNGEDIFIYDSQLKQKRQIKMEWYCWGIACDNFGCLYIATGSDLRRYKISGSTYECSTVDKSPFTLGVYEVFVKGNRIYIGGEKFVESFALVPASYSSTGDKTHIIDTKDKESFNVGGHVTAITANSQGQVFAITDKNNLYMFRHLKESDGMKTVRDKLTFSVLVTLKGVVCPNDNCVLLMGAKDEKSIIGWQSTVWTVPITKRGLLPAIPLLKLDERIKACALTNPDNLVLATVDSSNHRRLRVYRLRHENLVAESGDFAWGSNVFLTSPRA